MPKKPINYENTMFYKLVCNDLEVQEFYVGHTTDWSNRKSLHKYVCNTESSENYNLKIYKSIRANGGWNNWSMVLIERRSCADRLDAELYERKLTEDLQATLKMRRARLLPEERENYFTEYRTQNHAHINEKFTCTTCSGRYTRQNKSLHVKSKKHQLALSIPSQTIEATPSPTAEATATAPPPVEPITA